MANARAFRVGLKAALDAALSPPARSAALARVAKAELAQALRSGRAGESFRVFVDGRPDAPEESVRGDGRGVILYEFSYAAEAAAFALAYLRRRAPELSGAYREGFFVAVDGRMVDARAFDPRRVPPGAELIIGNRLPYNRLVDAQRRGRRAVSYRVPANLYADAVREIRRRFGNSVAAARVRDVAFPGKYRLSRAQVRKTGRYAGRVLRAEGSPVESPGLRLTPL